MKKRKGKLNNEELLAIKSLLADTQSDEFSIEEILAEYGARPQKSPHTHTQEDDAPAQAHESDTPTQEQPPVGENVVQFPFEPPREQPISAEIDDEGDEENDTQPQAEIIDFPPEQSVLGAFVKDVIDKADRYAEHMFEDDENTDPDEVRRLEQLIPGTDHESVPFAAAFRSRLKPNRPPPPDLDAQVLAKQYGKGLRWLRMRGLLVFSLGLCALLLALLPRLSALRAVVVTMPAVQRWVEAGLLGVGMVLGADILLSALKRTLHGKIGMDTMCLFACVFTLADAVLLALHGAQDRASLVLVALAGLWTQLHGAYHKRCALRLCCRTAAAAATPYRVSLDQRRWNGCNAYTKSAGTAAGFGSQIQCDDGVQEIFKRFCPLLMLADLLTVLLCTQNNHELDYVMWAFSSLFCATTALGGGIAHARAFHRVTRRLAQCGAALAGWSGVRAAANGEHVLVCDTDLFPAGYVQLNGYKIVGRFHVKQVLPYAASLIHDSGCGLDKVFHDQLRVMGGLLRKCKQLQLHEGGLSADIGTDQVLVGTANFMRLMEIDLPEDLCVNDAVFCAINDQLAGIFAVRYTLSEPVISSLDALMRDRLVPVLVTRDFNVIPAMLQSRFRLAAQRMDFPTVQRRYELSAPEQPHADTLTALLCREGLLPFSEAVVGARRLRRAVRTGSILCCVGSVFGLVLAGYLVSVQAYTSLSPLNLLIFLLSWLAPVWMLSSWVDRY